MGPKEVLCVILGGGRGSRLFPLTKERCKPAVPIFGKYRLIDIPISNCLNSGFNKIYVLTQFLSESLNKHIGRTYKMEPFSKGFVEIMAAEQTMDDTNWFQGTADAVRRCLRHFNDPSIKYVLILSGDQLYKMDLRDMYNQHVEKEAEVTVACNLVSREDASSFGIMGLNEHGYIKTFKEKPRDLSVIKDLAVEKDGNTFYPGSMGIYLFNKFTLNDMLRNSGMIDFGKEIIPSAIENMKVNAYIFDGYWRDIGTTKSFYYENLQLTKPMPPLDMFDERWLIYTRPRFLSPAKFHDCAVENSIVAEGAIVMSSRVLNSIIGLRFRVGAGTVIEDSIAMGSDYYETVGEIEEDAARGIPPMGAGKNCVIKKAIIDKNVRIGDNVKIINSNDKQDFDGPNYHIRDGIVIVTKNSVIPSGTVI